MEYEITLGESLTAEKVSLRRLFPFWVAQLESTNKEHTLAVIRRKSADQLLVSVDDRLLVELRIVRRSFDRLEFEINGEALKARKGRLDKHSGEGGGGVASFGEFVVANFPAKVVKIEVRPNQKIRENETIMILEAMKMEAQIKVPEDAIVAEIYVSQGDMVERGRRLARLARE